jgi:hypothetical protein
MMQIKKKPEFSRKKAAANVSESDGLEETDTFLAACVSFFLESDY